MVILQLEVRQHGVLRRWPESKKAVLDPTHKPNKTEHTVLTNSFVGILYAVSGIQKIQVTRIDYIL